MEAASRIGSFYAVAPGGEEGPEYFEATLAGLAGKHGAMQRAVALSAGNHVQVITRTTGRAVRRLFEYRDGRVTFCSGASLIPAAAEPPPPAPLPGTTVTVMTGRTRKRGRNSLPGISDPPCNGT